MNGVGLSVFADDSNIWRSEKSLLKIISDCQKYLIEVADFFNEWGLSQSKTKTVTVLLTK